MRKGRVKAAFRRKIRQRICLMTVWLLMPAYSLPSDHLDASHASFRPLSSLFAAYRDAAFVQNHPSALPPFFFSLHRLMLSALKHCSKRRVLFASLTFRARDDQRKSLLCHNTERRAVRWRVWGSEQAHRTFSQISQC